MSSGKNASYYVIYFDRGGKLRIAGRMFHTYEKAGDYADTIVSNKKPSVVKSVTR